ncbi:pancreatic triacylglycerol lipase-like [Ornithodoros turicata]|uniref:pancreatic triacylglycerol lipase-like n=1 Tax=Ornithodoros turicata TaxID=34597 RepID=UPI0031396EAC
MLTSWNLLLVAGLFSSTAESLWNWNLKECFGELGCFRTGGDFYDPLHRPISILPNSRRAVNTTFLLFTRKNPKQEHTLLWSSSLHDLRHSPFNASSRTKIIIHGWLDSIFFVGWMKEMAEALLLEGDYNVFLVDWKGGNGPPYAQATANTRLVGAEVALLIQKLQNAFGVDPMSFHIVGHSLGSHIAGYAGERIKTLGRITGLDPAQPYFKKMPRSVRIDPTDADFVEIIHTDGSQFFPNILKGNGLGLYDPVGHLDFYPNGGVHMPGCDYVARITKFFTSGLIAGKRAFLSCNHQRAVEYFTDSINDKRCLSMAYACKSHEVFNKGSCSDCGPDGSQCAPFGLHADRWRRFKNDSQSVRMFVNTNAETPYCLFEYIVYVNIEGDSNATRLRGYILLTLQGNEGATTLKLRNGVLQIWPTTRYKFMPTTPSSVGKIRTASLKYISYELVNKRGLHLKFVEIRSMNSAVLRSQRSESTLKMCPENTNRVQPYDTVPLIPC